MIADRAGLFVQAYTLYSSVRPFGVNALIATMDEYHSPQLFMIEPSGLYWVTSNLAFPFIVLGISWVCCRKGEAGCKNRD